MAEKNLLEQLHDVIRIKHCSIKTEKASTQNQALNAIVFLYKQVLKIKVRNIESIVWAKKPTRLPVVLKKIV